MSVQKVDFIGQAAGLLQDVQHRVVPLGFTQDALNVEYDQDGEIIFPRNGSRRHVRLASSAAVDGLWFLVRPDGTNVLFASSGTRLYSVDAMGAVTPEETGLAASPRPWDAEAYLGKLLLVNKDNAPRIYDTTLRVWGDETGASLPSSWVTGNWPRNIGLVAAGDNERLVAWGFEKEPSTVYFSALQNYLDWNAANDSFSISPLEEDGEEVVAVVGFHELVLVMKQTRTVVYKNLYPDAIQNNQVGRRVLPYGCVGPRSVIPLWNDVWWMSQDGPVSLRAADTYGDLAADVLGGRIQKTLADIDPMRRWQMIGYHDERFRRLSWYFAGRDDTNNRNRLDYYYDRTVEDHVGRKMGAWGLCEGVEVASVVSYQTAGPVIVLTGDFRGDIYQANFMYRDGNRPIESYFIHPDVDPGVRARVVEADYLIHKGGENLEASLIVDSTEERPISGDLSPAFTGKRPPFFARKVPYGYGHTFGMKIRHRQTADDNAVYSGWRGRVSAKGRR